MRVEHVAIDGSTVLIEAEADLNTGATAIGWAMVPSLLRSYPFSIHPAGHSEIIERTVRGQFRGLKVISSQDFQLKNGRLRVAEVELPTPTGIPRLLTAGAWEGRTGCLMTSLVGREPKQLVEVFDTLQFSEREKGLAIDSPVMPLPRAPEVFKEIPGLGILSIRPAIPVELERVPKASGLQVANGELFRYRAQSQSLLFVSRSTVVRINPPKGTEREGMLRAARSLRVEWEPRLSAN
jgi:hypothetical protein